MILNHLQQILRIEHQERLDAQKASELKNGTNRSTAAAAPLGVKRTVRGGTHATVRTVRTH